jgi:FAD/FMN-containing dehydrogenase/Fe-S oxidoreductase
MSLAETFPSRRVAHPPLHAEHEERTRSEIAPAERFSPSATQALERDLRASITGEVRFTPEDRALYATDASNYRQVPIGAVLPRSAEDVVATMALCRKHGAPFLSRGGGTSLAGQCCNVAVVVDYSKHFDRILEIDPERRRARIEPGVVLDTLRDAAEHHHLTFGPDPSTHDHNTLGGMLGNNSCGVHSVMAGRTLDNVRALEILTYDGLRMRVGPTSDEQLQEILRAGGRRAEIYRRLDALRRRYGDLVRARFPDIPRRVSGFALDQLLPENGFNVARALVGSEGTCVAILEAELDLVPSPPCRALVVIGFDSVYEAGDAVPRVLESKPIGLEGIDELLVQFMKEKHLREGALTLLPEGCGWLLAEFGGADEAEAAAKAHGLLQALGRENDKTARVYTKPEEQLQIWNVRRAGLGATAFVPHHPDSWEGWEDSAVPPAKVGAYLRDLKALFDKYGYESPLYGHFGDGCIHCRINFGLRTTEGIRKWRTFLDEAAELVVSYGGSISGEHGDGQSKAELLVKMFGPELIEAFREFKAIWDPEGKMNPGKVVDPYPITSNLRLGPNYVPPKLNTYFGFAEDKHSFAHAGMRCVGVGECRRHAPDGGVMCPSYQVTHEEKHSTRGRARLLFEMLHGGAIERTWRSDAVEDALSLCLACKGCRSDCPVNVDMATYKAEFRAHYFAGRLRPRAAYSMGLIHWWARLASAVPSLANFLTQTPGLAALVKAAGGIANERRMPAFADETFLAWMRRHTTPNPTGPRVLLFPDTFNNFFRPGTAIAATRVLEAAGWRVEVPRAPLCCGRPLYDWGMLDRAKAVLRGLMDGLGEALDDGVPIVGLEPACVAAFRDELPNLFPYDPRAAKLAEQTLLFSEFLDKCGDRIELPQANGHALVQVHCHHHAVLHSESERRVLDRLGLDYELAEAGCCGMAGSFGFEADKVEVSHRIGERALLPRVRSSDAETVIIADGFSCREQIEQGTDRPTHHLAEVIAREMFGRLPARRRPDRRALDRALLLGAIVVGGVALGAIAKGAAARLSR